MKYEVEDINRVWVLDELDTHNHPHTLVQFRDGAMYCSCSPNEEV